jgi:hypothetical protein
VTTTVVNVKTDPYDLYIGRANSTYGLVQSKWANPFRLEREQDRPIILARYRMWLTGQQNLMASLHELHGLRLGCWCAPKQCHGDVLAELAQSASANRPKGEIPPWSALPPNLRSLINSEQDKDRERAMSLCQEYGLDYEAARRRIILEMVAEYNANEPARERRRTGA